MALPYQLFQSWIENGRSNRVYIWCIRGIYHTVETPLEIWATALSGGSFGLSRTCFWKMAILSRLYKWALLWNVSKSLVFSWGFIRDPIGGLTTLPCKDTWNLVLVHLRKISRSAGRYSKMHCFKYELILLGGAHSPLPRPPLPAQSQASPSILGRFASSVRAAPSIHPSNMFDNPSLNRGVLDLTLFSPNPNFLATPLDPIFRSKIT